MLLRALPLVALFVSGIPVGDDGLPEESPWAARDAAAPEAACAPPVPGFLTLETKPWTIVYVDGLYAGSTPLFRERLTAGTHTLTLVNEARAISRNEDVVIEEGRARKLKLVLAVDDSAAALDNTTVVGLTPEDCALPPDEAASLSVDTQPWSRVFVDGRLVGSTPLFKYAIAAGDHVVRLVRADGRAAFARFNAAAGETVKLALAL